MSIEDFFSSSCTVRVVDGFDEYGKPTGHTPGTAKACRFDPVAKVVRDRDTGDNIAVDGFVYIAVADAPGPSDEIIVDGDTYRIVPEIGLKTQRGFSDPHHVKLAVRKVG